MKRACADQILGFLSFSNPCDPSAFKKFSIREWNKALEWLDDSSLAFYFRRKLGETNATDAIPAWVLDRLERSLSANQERIADMSRRFDFLNRKFSHAGVRFLVVKGFSLVPEFCSDSALRHQSDLDYLLDEQSLPEARRILVEAGYVEKQTSSSQESIFLMHCGKAAVRGAEQYSAQAPHAVELHLDVWDSEVHRLPLMPRLFSVDRGATHHWNGLTFPVLKDDDAFLLQVLHACHHIFTYWIRASCFWEIGFFLNRRASDVVLWNQVDLRIGDNRMLREFVVIITELSARLFKSPIPPLVRHWGRSLIPATRVWIEHYGRDSVFSKLPSHEFRLFPKSKLILLLHQEYEDACGELRAAQSRLTKFARVSHMKSSLREQPSLIVNLAWWREHRVIQRSLFHLLAGLRYFCEIPRWKWRNRARGSSHATWSVVERASRPRAS